MDEKSSVETEIHSAILQALNDIGINDFHVTINNISHQHAGHFDGNGNSHFNIVVKSNKLFAKKPLERHRILNDSTAKFMQKIHSISFKVET